MKARSLLLFAVFWSGSLYQSSQVQASEIIISKSHPGWKVYDAAEPPPSEWTKLDFDDAGWKNGFAPLGYGEDEIKTEISYGQDENQKHPAAYFRVTFILDAPDETAYYGVRARVDDGAVLYLNGKEIDRIRMPAGELKRNEYLAEKLRGSDPLEDAYLFVGFRHKALREGKNVLAVSVHQADAESSDLFLDAEVLELTFEEFRSFKRERLDQNADADLRRIQASFQVKVDAFYKRYQAAADAEERKAMQQEFPKAGDELVAVNRLIESYPKAPAVVDAVIWLMSHQSFNDTHRELLLEHHLESPKMLNFCMRAMYAADTRDTLEQIMEQSPHDEVKGAAAFGIAQQLSRSPSEESRKEMEDLLTKAIPLLGDAEYSNRSLSKMAEGLLFETTKLGIGLKAPEIVGTDTEGVEFKLSDYLGKVVVIDFWGDW